MNTEIDIIVDFDGMAPVDVFLSVELLFQAQERRFSRFLPESQLSALNRGEEVDDRQFASGIGLALEAFTFTGGLFNPMVLPSLRDAGYAGSFETVSGGAPRAQPVPNPRECLVHRGDRVSLREGQVDLGGIVKGWTVDLAIGSFGARAPDLYINAGGDVRCCGRENGRQGWDCAVAGLAGADAWAGRLDGALATSTSRKRSWLTADGETAHHLIDPRTGLPAQSPVAQASAWAPETWRAECWAKVVLIGGEAGARAAHGAGIRTLALGHDGSPLWNG
jgi:thiamine biosynthesis lipoprotein